MPGSSYADNERLRRTGSSLEEGEYAQGLQLTAAGPQQALGHEMSWHEMPLDTAYCLFSASG
jgi:hypothetical protein